jgi:hypothetical protein
MMRQLEHALGLLADRAEPIPVDVLVRRLEAQLAADGTAPDTAAGDAADTPTGPTVRDGLGTGRRQNPWRGPLIAAGTAVAILVIVSVSMFFLGGDTGDVIIQPAPTTTMPAVQDDPTAIPAPIDVTWSYQGTVDDWLTEPVLFNGMLYATRKGLGDDAQPNENGLVEGTIEEAGELWTSLDGVTWIRADEGEQPPPASPEASTDGAAVVVRRNPTGDLYGMLVSEGLWATSDGTSWREIPLRPSQDNWIPWVATGELGWVVYSPPREATVEADGSSAFQGQRNGNLGVWYTPDTEAWFEVTDLGPLANAVYNLGEVGVIDTAIIVRDTDILVYAYIARSGAYGIMSNPHTEIWQLDLAPGDSVEAFDFSTQDLCEWFSADDITRIVASAYEEHGSTPPSEPMTRSQDMNFDCFWSGGGLVLLTMNDGQLPSEPFGSHPSLDETAHMLILNYGSFGLTDGVEALLEVDGHKEQLRFGHAVAHTPEDIELTNAIGLTIANTMLQEMGWTDAE